MDLSADDYSARFENLIPTDVEFFAIDFALGGGAKLKTSKRTWHFRRDFGLESHRACGSTNREIAGDVERISAGGLDLSRFERDLRMVFHVQEVGALEVTVALLVLGGKGAGLNSDIDLALARVLLVGDDRSGYIGQFPMDLGNHKVPSPE